MKDNSLTYQRILLVILWVGCTFGFITDEIIPPLAQWRPMVYVCLDALWIALAACTVRRRAHLIGIAVMLVVTFVFTCLFNGMTIAFWANGVREFLGLMLAYPVMCYFMGEPDRRHSFEPVLERFLIYFLLLQAVCITFQFIKYGAGDHCGGSFGGWYSGQVSTCIYIASFYLVHKRIDPANVLHSLKQCKLPIILLFPTFLNETKISFVLIALYFLLLMPLDRRYVVRAMWSIPFALALGWIVVSVYTMSIKGDGDIFSVEYITEYVSSEDLDEAEQGALWAIGEGIAADVPRFTKIMFLPVLYDQDPGHEMTGWGVGQFKGGNGIEVSEFADQYDWLLVGSIPYVFHVIIQLGNVGVVLVAVWLLLLLVQAPAWSKGRDYNTQLMVLLIICIIMGYNDSLRDLWMCLFLFMLLASSWIPRDDSDTEALDIDDNKLQVTENSPQQ